MNGRRMAHGAIWGGVVGLLVLLLVESKHAPDLLMYSVGGALLILMLASTAILPSPPPRPSMFLMIPNLPDGADIFAYIGFVALFMVFGGVAAYVRVRLRRPANPASTISFVSGLLLFCVLTFMMTRSYADERRAGDPAFHADGHFNLSVDKSLYLKPGRSLLWADSAFVTFIEDLAPGSDGIEVVFPSRTIKSPAVAPLMQRGSEILKDDDHAILSVTLNKEHIAQEVTLTYVKEGQKVVRTVAVTPEAAKRQFRTRSFDADRFVLKSSGSFQETETTEGITLTWSIYLDLPVARRVSRK